MNVRETEMFFKQKKKKKSRPDQDLFSHPTYEKSKSSDQRLNYEPSICSTSRVHIKPRLFSILIFSVGSNQRKGGV